VSKRNKRRHTFKARMKQFPSIKDGSIEHVYPLAGAKTTQIAEQDRHCLETTQACSFLRAYVPNEFKGMPLPADTDLSKIVNILVVRPVSTEHLKKHLGPLVDNGQGPAAIIIDDQDGYPAHARILLTKEQGAKVLASRITEMKG